jgi:autotransporter-associated beta strand protein
LAPGSSGQLFASLVPGRPAGPIDDVLGLSFADESSLPGASSGLGSGSVRVTGGVYRLAVGSVGSGAVSFAAVREGATLTAGSLLVRNVASSDGYSDHLTAVFGSMDSKVFGAGTLRGLVAGSLGAGTFTLGYDTAGLSAGSWQSTAAVSYLSEGRSGLGLVDAVPVEATTSVSLGGSVYRLAVGSLSSGTIELGKVRANFPLSSATLLVTNAATADPYSDLLRFNALSLGGFSLSGGSATLAAGASGSLTVLPGGSLGIAGVRSETISVAYTSVGRPGTDLADHVLPSGTLVVSGTIYTPAAGTLALGGSLLAHSGTIQFANIRENQTFVPASVDIRNTATVTPGYNETLNARTIDTQGFAVATGSASLVVAGGTSTGALTLTPGTGSFPTAGRYPGVVTVAYETDGTGTSGLGAIAAGTQILRLSGAVYRLATGSLNDSTVRLPAVRVGGTFTTGSVKVSNASRADDGLSEKLNVSLSVTGGNGVVTGGSIGRLAAGATDSTALRVGLGGALLTSVAGLKTGTMAVSYQSDGAGTSGLAPTATNAAETLNVQGKVYRLASGSLSTATLHLGNIRVNEAVSSGSLTLTNAEATDGYSDLLRYSGAIAPPGFRLVGGTALLAAGSSAQLAIAYQELTATGGPTAGTLTFGMTSVGQDQTELPDHPLASQTVSVVATVYRKAAGALVSGGSAVADGGTLRLAAIREGGVFAPIGVGVLNAVEADAFSEALNVTVAGSSGFGVGTGSVRRLAAGSVAVGTLSFGLGGGTFATAGRQKGSVTVGMETDGTGTSGLGTLAVGTQTVQLVGDVYRLAVGSLGNGGAVRLGAIRENEAFADKKVAVTNAASSEDGFSDDLIAAVGATTGGVSASGNTGRVAAGSANSTALSVGYTGNTAAAGRVSGTALVSFRSVGREVSALEEVDAAVRGATVEVSGEVYRLAVGSLSTTTFNLGNIRAKDAVVAGSLTLLNATATDGYSDLLHYSTSADASGFGVSGGSAVLSAGSTAQLGITYRDLSAAGPRTGTLTVGLTSVGRTGTELADVTLASRTVSVAATVYREAVLTLDGDAPARVDLGRVRVGGAFASGSLRLGNGAVPDDFSDDLRVRWDGREGMTVGGSGSVLLRAGSSTQLAVNYGGTTLVAGYKTGTIVLQPTSLAKALGLSDVAQAERTVQVQGLVYSGQGVWTGSGGSGVWTDWNNWQAEGGRPGLDGAESRHNDSATIAAGTVALAVTLPAQPVELQRLTLSGAGGVTLSGTADSAVALGASGTQTATLSASGGAHVVAAPLSLSGASIFDVGAEARLTIGGLVTGGSVGGTTLTKTGAGTLFLAEGYTFSGDTVVSDGKLELGLSAALRGDASNTDRLVDSGTRQITLGLAGSVARLEFVGLTKDLYLPNTVIVGGEEYVSSAQSEFNVEWKGGSTTKQIAPGDALDASSLTSGATIQIAGGGTLFLAGGGSKVLKNKLVFGSTLNLAVNAGGTLVLGGVLSDGTSAGTLVKNNDGLVVLGGSNAYSGGTEVRRGTLELRNSRGAGTGAVLVGTAAVLDLNAEEGSTLMLDNRIAGDGALVKSGSGIVVLAGTSNALAGPTSVAAGTLEIRQNGVLGTGAVSVGANAALRLSPGPGDTIALGNRIGGDGRVVKDGPGTFVLDDTTLQGVTRGGLVLNAGSLEFSGSVNMAVPMLLAGSVALRTVAAAGALSGPLSGTGVLNVTGVLDGGANVVGGSVTINGGTLTAFEKRGAGELTLGEGAAVGGAVAQVAAGTLRITSGETLARVTTLEIGTGRDSGAVLDASRVAGGLVVGGGSIPQVLKGSGKVRGSVSLGRGATIAPGNSPGTQTIEGELRVGPGAVYQVEYTFSGGLVNDLLRVEAPAGVVGGSVNLQGGLVDPRVSFVSAKGGNILTKTGDKQTLRILETSGGILGQFDGVRQSAALRASLVYMDGAGNRIDLAGQPASAGAASGTGAPLAVWLELERNSYAALGNTKARVAAGRGLDLLVEASAYNADISTPGEIGKLEEIQKAVSFFDGLELAASPVSGGSADAVAPAGAAPAAPGPESVAAAQPSGMGLLAAMDAVFPKAFAEMYTLSLSRVQDAQKTVSDRLNLLGTAITTLSEQEVLSLATGTGGEWNAWTTGYASFRSKAANLAAGEGGSNVNAFGDVTGVEHRFGRATFGILGASGYATTQLNQPSSSVRSTSWHMGMYVSIPVGRRLFADVSGFYGEAENVIRQNQLAINGGTAAMLPGRALMETQEWLLQAGVGGQMAGEGSRWSLVPSARFAYTGMHFGKAQIEGVGPLGIKSDSTWNATLLSRVGLDVAREFNLVRLPVRLTGSAAWVHDFNTAPRHMSVAWQGLEDRRWRVGSGGSASDLLRLGGAIEFGIGDRRTLRLYGEQEFLQGRNVFRGGFSFTIGF